jgi:hypothetical protein
MAGGQGRGKLNWLTRIRFQKMLAKERGDEISDEEAKRRAVAKLHRPKLKRLYNEDRYVGGPYDPRLYEGAEVALSRVGLRCRIVCRSSRRRFTLGGIMKRSPKKSLA